MDIEHCLMIGGAFLGLFLDRVSGSDELRASRWGGADRFIGDMVGVGGV